MSTASAPQRYRTPAEVASAGLGALVRTLGVADAARFLQQYGPGLGDYTAERDVLLADLTMDEVLTLARRHDPARDAEPGEAAPA